MCPLPCVYTPQSIGRRRRPPRRRRPRRRRFATHSTFYYTFNFLLHIQLSATHSTFYYTFNFLLHIQRSSTHSLFLLHIHIFSPHPCINMLHPRISMLHRQLVKHPDTPPHIKDLALKNTSTQTPTSICPYTWRSFGLHLQVIWPTSGRHFGYIWRSFGLHLEVI